MLSKAQVREKVGSNSKQADRITLMDFIPIKFESTFTCQLVDHKQIIKGKSFFKNMDDVFSAALMLGATYGLLMGSSYAHIFRNAATEMMRFFANMDAQEDGPNRTFNAQRMMEIYDHLLYKYCDQVACTASAIAAQIRVGSELALTARCKKVAAYLKIPNIMDMSHPNGYFRAEFKRTIERKIATKKRADSWQQALAEEQDVISTVVSGLKNIPWKKEICVESWQEAAFQYASRVPSTHLQGVLREVNEDFLEFMPRIVESHPRCDELSKFMCLRYNTHKGCNNNNCQMSHGEFSLLRGNRDIELIMLLLGGHKMNKKLDSISEIQEEYKKLRREYFDEINKNAIIPEKNVSLSDHGDIIVQGDLTKDVEKQVRSQAIAG